MRVLVRPLRPPLRLQLPLLQREVDDLVQTDLLVLVEGLYAFGKDVDVGDGEELGDCGLLFLGSREVDDGFGLGLGSGFGGLLGLYADHVKKFLGFGL